MKTLALLATLAVSTSALRGGEVYKLSEQHLGKDSPWSGKDLSLRLVPGDDGKVNFKLPELPAHKFLKVVLDIQIGGAMGNFGRAGDSPGEADTRLRIKTKGGPTLLDASFASMRIGQSYPDTYGGFIHPPGTGATAPKKNNAAGRVQIGGLGQVSSGQYSIDLLFPHDGETLELEFDWDKGKGGGRNANFAIQINGMKLGGSGSAPYTLSDVIVSAFEEAPTELDDAKVSQLLKAISGKDAPAARTALNELIGAGLAALPHIREVFEVEPDPELADKIAEFAEGLRSDDFKERTVAEASLGKLGAEAIPHLAKVLEDRDSLSVDVRTGLEKVKQRLERDAKDSPEQTLANRIRPALPLFGSDEAKAIEKMLPKLKKLDHVDAKPDKKNAGVRIERAEARIEIAPKKAEPKKK